MGFTHTHTHTHSIHPSHPSHPSDDDPLCSSTDTMGRVRTKTTKKAARVMVEKYYNRLTLDFQTNKKIAEEVAVIPSKRLRNKIAGFATHLMKRIQRGPVRGISLKLQEEERERRLDFVPDESALPTDFIEVDRDTMDMLRGMGMAQLPGVVLSAGGGGNQSRGDRRGR